MMDYYCPRQRIGTFTVFREALFALLLFSSNQALAEKFSLIIIPDTQIAVDRKPELFSAMTEWIVAQKDVLNIRFVLHEGDIVEWPTSTRMWDDAKAAMDILDDYLPYTIVIGNHDIDAWADGTNSAIAVDRTCNYFNTYFPRSKFDSLSTFGDTYPSNLNDNSYHVFSAGGVDWLVVTLKHEPTSNELNWADNIIADNPDRQVIIVTHYYLSPNGTRSSAGQNMWDNLVKKHANILFVFSGHVTMAALLESITDGGTKVYQILADYQTYNNDMIDRNSYLRIAEIDTDAKMVSFKTYSPYLDQYMTDPSNDFTLQNIDFLKSPTTGIPQELPLITTGNGGIVIEVSGLQSLLKSKLTVTLLDVKGKIRYLRFSQFNSGKSRIFLDQRALGDLAPGIYKIRIQGTLAGGIPVRLEGHWAPLGF